MNNIDLRIHKESIKNNPFFDKSICVIFDNDDKENYNDCKNIVNKSNSSRNILVIGIITFIIMFGISLSIFWNPSYGGSGWEISSVISFLILAAVIMYYIITQENLKEERENLSNLINV